MRPIQWAIVIALALSAATGCREGARDMGDSTPGRDAQPAELDCGMEAGLGSGTAAAPAAGVGDVQVDGGIGVLRIGASVEEVRERCTIIRDTTVLDIEGMPARRLVVSLAGDSAVAEIVADSVWRLRLTSPRFRTRAGFGPGTRVSELAAQGGARALVGEGEVYVTIPASCGVSYRIAGADFSRVAGVRSPERAMAELPDGAQVDLLLVTSCATSDAVPDSAAR